MGLQESACTGAWFFVTLTMYGVCRYIRITPFLIRHKLYVSMAEKSVPRYTRKVHDCSDRRTHETVEENSTDYPSEGKWLKWTVLEVQKIRFTARFLIQAFKKYSRDTHPPSFPFQSQQGPWSFGLWGTLDLRRPAYKKCEQIMYEKKRNRSPYITDQWGNLHSRIIWPVFTHNDSTRLLNPSFPLD